MWSESCSEDKASLPLVTDVPASSRRSGGSAWLSLRSDVTWWQEELDEIATFSDALRARGLVGGMSSCHDGALQCCG